MAHAAVHLRRVALTGLEEARPAGIPALDTYDEVAEAAGRLGLSDALSLFARPSVTRSNGVNPGTVVWSGVSAGVIIPLRNADAQTREAAQAAIAQDIGRLQPLLDDPRAGPLFAAWLNVPSPEDDVLLVNRRPVITNWGLLPPDIARVPSARRAHFGRGLGALLPPSFAPPPSAFADEVPAANAAPSPAAARFAEANAGRPSASSPSPPVPPAGPPLADGAPFVRPWAPVAVASGIAALLLAILLIPGVLKYPLEQPAARGVDPNVIDQTRQTLQRRLESLQTMLRQGTCVPAEPTGPRPTGQPAAPGQPPATQPLIPPSPERISAPPAGGGQTTNLIAHLDRTTALIVSPNREGNNVSIGTGFFIDPQRLVTNRHVIEEGDPDRLLVVNKTFGRGVKGRITASTSSSEIGGTDFAVIEIDGVQGTPMTLTNTVSRGDNVVAAGFPGVVMSRDQVFRRLIDNGDLTSIPDPVVTQGWVTATQTTEHGLPVLVHGATISQGNSGGPLTDLCGRAVGMNTYNAVQAENALRLNYALRTDGLRKFLDERHITYRTDDAACQPSTLPPGTSAAATPGAVPSSPPQPAPGPSGVNPGVNPGANPAANPGAANARPEAAQPPAPLPASPPGTSAGADPAAAPPSPAPAPSQR